MRAGIHGRHAHGCRAVARFIRATATIIVVVGCGPEQPQGIPPIEICLPPDVPAETVEAIERGVVAIETQAGIDAFEIVDGGHCGGAWGTADVVIHDDSSDGHYFCERRADSVKKCKIWLPREIGADASCGAPLALHELGHVALGTEHVDGTAMAANCQDGAPYFAHEQLERMRAYFLRGERREGGAR